MTADMNPLAPPAVAARVAARIRRNPAQHDQGEWWITRGGEGEYRVRAVVDTPEAALCGTTACVAGWAVYEYLAAGGDLRYEETIPQAAWQALGGSGDFDDEYPGMPELFDEATSAIRVLEILDGIAAGGKP